MTKKIIKIITGLIIVLLLVILVKGLMLKSRQLELDSVDKIPITKSSIINLSRAIQFKTISNADTSRVDWAEFRGFIEFIEKTYPLVDSFLHKELINEYSLLYRWDGKNSDLKPVILTAHYDVVPVEKESLEKWTEDPFGGRIDESFIWGRGTMDDKLSVIGIIEAIEKLLFEGYIPERTIYLAFGHDEEISGFNGGLQIAIYLDQNNIKPEFILDEGLIIVRRQVPGVKKDVAMVGLSEKGFMSVELSVDMTAGHASMPPDKTAIGLMSEAIVKLRNNQPKARVSEPIKRFFDYIGPEMSFAYKTVFANTWLFKGIILNIYNSKPASNALVTTTTAPTIFKSGFQDNVLPANAKATFNFRILPGTSSEELLKHIKDVIDDERINIQAFPNISEPSPVSPVDSYGFKLIERTIRQIFPETVVSPSLVNAASDSRHYYRICNNIYRFIPYIAETKDLDRFHGNNERLNIEVFKDCIRFYYQLVKNCDLKTGV